MIRVDRSALRLALFAAVCMAFLCLHTTGAHADKASCLVLEVHAMKGAAKMDATIPKKLARKLLRPPFKSWKRFRLAQGTRRLFAKPGVRQNVKLRAGSLVLQRHPNANNQYKLGVMLKNRRGKRVLRTKVGIPAKAYILFAGLPLESPTKPGARKAPARRRASPKAMQVLALSCRPVP